MRRPSDTLMSTQRCSNCGIGLLGAIDSDPNGDGDGTCARCRAEEAHDFDAQPNVEFTRGGVMMDRSDVPDAAVEAAFNLPNMPDDLARVLTRRHVRWMLAAAAPHMQRSPPPSNNSFDAEVIRAAANHIEASGCPRHHALLREVADRLSAAPRRVD